MLGRSCVQNVRAPARPTHPRPQPHGTPDAGGRLDRDSDGGRGDGPDRRRGGRWRPVALCHSGPLLLVAGLGAGNAPSAATSAWAARRRDRPTVSGQALRMAASTARNSKTAIGAAHRRRLSRMDSSQSGQGHRPSTGAADIRHADRWRAIRRAGSGNDGNGAPRPPNQEPAASSAALRSGACAGRTSRLKAGTFHQESMGYCARRSLVREVQRD